MPIQALPQTTVRSLGANQVLTDSASVVKELIDNAIDAAATSVAVEIHHNTLDVVQVRDNGHGIPPEDRPLVARRYCTSKISHDDELKDIGGSSLGFRGEALASAAELSGSLTISTRIEGEPVAAALKISQTGEITGQERASLPVGTIVRIADFIKTNPVRRQLALKNTEPCLKKIKRLLQAYALARPHVRFSLRVLKARNTKGDWVYAPKSNCNAEDATFKVVGSACASQCTWSVHEEAGFIFQAFLPGREAEASKISSHGAFLSIDRRPVSSARGTPKQIVRAFREALKNAGPQLEDVKEPFLFLEITCPKGSYDANLEPAKDDVLFEDSSLVVEGARKLFATVYADRAISHPKDQSQMVHEVIRTQEIVDTVRPERSAQLAKLENVQTGPAITNHKTPGAQTVEDFDLLTNKESDHSPHQHFHSNMYSFDEDDLTLFESRSTTSRIIDHMQEVRQARRDVNLSNPFVLAKLNSTIKLPAAQHLTPDHNDRGLNSHVQSPLLRSARDASPGIQAFPTPRPSSPLSRLQEHRPLYQDHEKGASFLNSDANIPCQTPQTPLHPDPEPDQDMPSAMPARNEVPPAYNHILSGQSTDLPSGISLNAIPDVNTRPRAKRQPKQSGMNRPFKPPRKDQSAREQVWFDFDHFDKRQHRPSRYRKDNCLVTQGELDDLEHDPRPLTSSRRNRDIRDFVGTSAPESAASMIERRNYSGPSTPFDLDAQEDQRSAVEESQQPDTRLGGFVSAAEVAIMQAYRSSPKKQKAQPPKQRKTSKRRALKELSANAPLSHDDDDDDDEPVQSTTKSRRISRRRSPKFGRTKSSQLSLERIPGGHSTIRLIHHCSTSPTEISRLAGEIDDNSSLLRYNQPAVGFDSILSSDGLNLHELANDLHDLLLSCGGDDAGEPTPTQLFEELRAAFAKQSLMLRVEDEDDLVLF